MTSGQDANWNNFQELESQNATISHSRHDVFNDTPEFTVAMKDCTILQTCKERQTEASARSS